MLKSKGIITDLQRGILFILSKVSNSESFYLTGGTALADFFLGHRRSFDLDIFTIEKGLILPFSYTLEEEIKKKFSLKVVRRFEAFVEFEVSDREKSTKIHIGYDSPFRFEGPIDSEFGVKVNDYKDMIVDKLLTFFGRAEPRDAVDLFFILQTEEFWNLTKLAFQKDPGFDLYWLAVALKKVEGFPDNIDEWPVEMIKKIDINELKDLFLGLSIETMDKIKPKDEVIE